MLKTIFKLSLFVLLSLVQVNLVATDISAFVWKDSNGDGFQSLGELGIPNVVVKLYDCDDTYIAEVTTDLTGKYLFTDVALGSYYLVFDVSSLTTDCAFTLRGLIGSPTDNDADLSGTTACFDVVMDEDVTDIDAGLLPLAQVCGNVWEDFDGDGIRDGDEFDLKGFAVELFDEDGNFVVRTATDSLGYYSFDTIYPDYYFLKFHPLPGWEITFANQEPTDTLDNDVDWKNGIGTTETFFLAAGANDCSWDAGYFTCGELGKWVWYDTNFNDIFEAVENGVNGMIVNAYRLINDEWVYWTQEVAGHKAGTPSDDGYFTMCLPPGKYYLEYQTTFTNLVPVRPLVGSTVGISSSVSEENGLYTTDTIVMYSGVDKCNVNAGFYPEAKIGNLVWKDENADGIYQDYEPPISGVTVELYTAQDTLVDTQVTDNQGEFVFSKIRKGDYYLKFYPNDDCIVTQANMGFDDEVDSDVNDANGLFTTDTFSVDPDSEVFNIDLGLTFVVLPIGLTSFTSEREDDDILLSWRMANEIDISHYIIERRYAYESDFRAIGTLDNKDPQGIGHQYVDTNVQQGGDIYYRLTIKGSDGGSFESRIISISLDNLSKLEFFPNPTSDKLWLHAPDIGDYTIQVLSLEGRLLIQQHSSQQWIDVARLPSGNYILQVVSQLGDQENHLFYKE